MAGGIFDDKPFAINIKCVIISIIGILLFIFPGLDFLNKGSGIAFFIIISILFISLYVAIAYYDYLYDCEPKFKIGKYSITRALKPPQKEESEINRKRAIYIFHAMFVAPLLILSNFYPSAWIQPSVAMTGVMALFYHAAKLSEI